MEGPLSTSVSVYFRFKAFYAHSLRSEHVFVKIIKKHTQEIVIILLFRLLVAAAWQGAQHYHQRRLAAIAVNVPNVQPEIYDSHSRLCLSSLSSLAVSKLLFLPPVSFLFRGCQYSRQIILLKKIRST